MNAGSGQPAPASAPDLAAAQLHRFVAIGRASLEETGEIAPEIWEYIDAAADELVEALRAAKL